jgi:hypothetical protein
MDCWENAETMMSKWKSMLAVIKRKGLIRILLIFLQVIIIISFMDAATMFFSQKQSMRIL